MYRIKIIRHQDIKKSEIDEVINIKSSQWKYCYVEQLNWINKNIKKSDTHIILYLNGKGVAYLNLIDINLIANAEHVKGFGIGNVCAIERGMGYGLELMKLTNTYIIENNKIGILFCKDALIRFYSSLDWKLLSIKDKDVNCKVMIYNNIYDEDTSIIYSGEIF